MPLDFQPAIDAILAGKTPLPPAGEFADLIYSLQNKQQFSIAGQLLAQAIARQPATVQDNLPVVALARRDVATLHDGNTAGNDYSLLWLIQQQALCTYKDPNRVPNERYNKALELLNRIGLSNPNLSNAETLALGAAVYKHSWELLGLVDDLNRSLALYEAGWDRNNQDPDSCYCADQAAFIYDLLAFRMGTGAREGHILNPANDGNGAYQDERAIHYRQCAQRLREIALAEIQRRQRLWPQFFQEDVRSLITLANLQLGLGLVDTHLLPAATGSYEAALGLMQQAASAGPQPGPQPGAQPSAQHQAEEWAVQEVFKQAMALTRMHNYLPPECSNPGVDNPQPDWQLVEPVFRALLGKDSSAAHTYHRGKVGLGLSGGGFRAAFYHIGVMTRMAEVDALRSIEVLSTVSGGSVIGAHYYLEVQRLLQSKPDQQLTQKDFIDLMARLQTDFLAGVQRNIGARVNSSLYANWRMTQTGYSNSCRIGELYEKELFSRVQDGHAADQPRIMPELMIHPAGQPDFNPRYDNWRRINKTPILLLNTTSFNTGHNWHFTASWMGEPPGLLKNAVDSTERYRRLYYSQAPTKPLQQFRLGYAVAASSCVPGIFAAIALPGLYPDRVVNLLDGGVHDNQGLAGLLDEGCTRILCSDASGQMAEDLVPTTSTLGVPMRANAILQDRIRGVQYQDVRVRADTQALHGLFFVHLKQGLDSAPINWIGCDEPVISTRGNPAGGFTTNSAASNTTPYGIDQDLQRRIAAIRTDLDSFTEVEAYSLMLSGYLTSEYEFKALQEQHSQQGLPGTWGGYQIDAPRGNWPFLQVEDVMRRPANPHDEQRCELDKQLEVASIVYFKIWHLNPGLKWLAKGIGAALLLAVIYFLWQNWNQPVAPILGKLNWGWALLLMFGPSLLLAIAPVKQMLTPKSSAPGWLHKSIMGTLAAAIANIHLALFENMFLRQGKIDRLMKMKGPQ